jgi:hypothetical protein
MNHTKLVLVFALFLATFLTVNAQSKTATLHFKKGEVLDILLFTGKPEMGKLFPRYKETAFAFALESGYQPQPILTISETTQGGIQPGNFVFGKWKSMASRIQFLDKIEEKVPDFHEQRRAMWSLFNLSFYEMTEDVSFEINPDKIIVVTAYWKENSSKFKSFKKDWIYKMKNNGGKILIALENPKSSFGYMYKPDFMVLTEWKDRATFDVFNKERMKMGQKGIKNVNEFIIK